MILEKIRQAYPGLTKSQKQLADYIVSSYREAAFMTASRLARRLGLNEATVIRFAQRLGYAGYPQMIEEVRQVVYAELGTAPPAPHAAPNPLADVFEIELDNLKRAISHIPDETARAAVRMIREARHIHAFGQGAGAPLAQLLSTGLREIGYSADSPAADPLNLAMTLREVSKGHLVIAISVALETHELANALRFAQEHGTHTMALTWSHTSRCAQAAELAVSYLADDNLPMRSITPLAMIIDALLQALASADEASRSRVAEFSGQLSAISYQLSTISRKPSG